MFIDSQISVSQGRPHKGLGTWLRAILPAYIQTHKYTHHSPQTPSKGLDGGKRKVTGSVLNWLWASVQLYPSEQHHGLGPVFVFLAVEREGEAKV